MPNLDLKLDVSRLQAEQRAKEEKKRKEEDSLRLQARKQHVKRPNPQQNHTDTIAKIVLQPLTSGRATPAANRQQRPLSKPERASLSQQKQSMRGSFAEVLGESAPLLSKRTVSGLGTTIKDQVAQLRLLLQKSFQNTSANKKLQQQKEAALQEALQQQRAAAEEEERKLSHRF